MKEIFEKAAHFSNLFHKLYTIPLKIHALFLTSFVDKVDKSVHNSLICASNFVNR